MERTWTEAEGYRWAPLDVAGSKPGFTALDSATTGVGFVNTLEESSFLENRHYVNGAGVAIGDVNGDDWPDLYFTRADGPNALYLNQGGFRFEPVAGAGGAALPGQYSTGALLEDLDGDGDLDLVVTTTGGPAALFMNDGTGQFSRTASPLQRGRGGTTMAAADIEGDGDLDLYIGNYKTATVKDLYPPDERRFEQVVMREGESTFRVRPPFDAHYEVRRQGNRLMRFEYGEADRLLINDGTGAFAAASMTGERFRTAAGAPLAEAPRDWALVARFQDLNGDGVPDLYVCNDFESPDHVWLGDGQGGFQAMEVTALRKTSHSTMSIAFTDVNKDGALDFFLADMLARTHEDRHRQTSMTNPEPKEVGGVDDRMQAMQNTLLLNRGDSTYTEMARMAGVEASGWTWSSAFVDVDLDGHDDLLLTNGHHYNAIDADTQMRLANTQRAPVQNWRRSLLEYPSLDLHNVAFRNRGDGTFAAMPEGWGLGAEADVSHGMATGDLDRDGDLDVVVSRMNRPAGIYRSDAPGARLAVRLQGRGGNRRGIGAQVTVEAPGRPVQTEEMVSGGQYLSSSEAVATFGASAAGDTARVTVRWRSGAVSQVTGPANRIYEIEEPPAEASSAEASPAKESAASGGAFTRIALSGRQASSGPDGSAPNTSAPDTSGVVFEEITDRLGHTHAEVQYADFQRQPLMARRLSQQGPAAAWGDLDADGDDDLLIGTGRTGQLAYYRNDGRGRFRQVTGGDLGRTFERDLTGIAILPTAGGATVLVGFSNYERQPSDPARPSKILVYDASASGLTLREELDAGPHSVGALTLLDADGDGDLDLFASGRHVPGRYPASASSTLFVNNGSGQFQPSPRLSQPFRDVGMVSGAVAADFDADADPDLVLATEWGPLQYFENQGSGRFVDRTEARGLDAFTGWWNGVAVGDFDGDGRPDLVATNWGWNSQYGRPEGSPENPDAPALPHPLRVYYADFDRNGSLDLVETQYHAERNEYVPFLGLSEIAQAVPYVRRRMRSFEQFASASLPEIFGASRFESAAVKEATTLSHMVFLNRDEGGVRFAGRSLPMWAQLAPAYAASVADMDGDGHEDVFLSQNFFATRIKMPRQDGGRGLWLKGDGTGQFTPVKGHHSGVKVYGEQRAAPLADIDQDGRVDLLVTQNGAATRLFRNTGAQPGLRVQLNGSSENLRGVGASVRLRFADGSRGPMRVVTAGAGYWSQHSATLVMGRGDRAVDAVEVTWPDGTTTEQPVPDDARAITVAHDAPAQ